MSAAPFHLRPYRPADEDAAIALWQRAWQTAYPAVDFAHRLPWWRKRWRDELVPRATIILAEQDAVLVGFVTVDTAGYLDQLVVAPEHWGTGAAAHLMAAAKRLSPCGLDLQVNQDNLRAVRFYEKHGFAVAGADANPLSGRPTWRMQWRPEA